MTRYQITIVIGSPVSMGIVDEDELDDKLAYLLHGVREDYRDRVVITSIPGYISKTLPEMARERGIA